MRYAVSYINFYENVLYLDIVEATDWKTALQIALSTEKYIPEDMEEAKEYFFDGDSAFEVIEIKD